ncbi:MAG: ferrous iron transport protein B [Ignavibacteriaceae bacterium]
MSQQVVEEYPLITLVGPPNSGKTTLFNLLSGRNYKTVNYPGSTVEYSMCRIMEHYSIKADLLDSPGIISLIPYSPDEEVSVKSLFNHPELGTPDLVIVTVDASQLSRHLLLVKQLLAAKFRIIVAITMTDLLNRKGKDIDTEKLSKHLNCDVVKIDGRNGNGIRSLLEKIESNIKTEGIKPEEVIEYPGNSFDKDSLLFLYKEINRIADDVIIDYETVKPNLSRANKSLKILEETFSRNGNDVDNLTLKIDKILLHRFWGLFFFFLIMALTFTSIFWLADPLMNLIDAGFGSLASLTESAFGDTWYSHLISDGIISGTGSVLVFLPQIVILFLILGLLEDTGYLARGAMLIDKPLSKIGLNGRSFVPMLSGFACAIPAMMASRTIPNRRERLLTIFIIPLMSCSARLPVYALLLAYLTPADKPWLGGVGLASIYIFSILSSVTVAGIINKMKRKIIRDSDPSSFILELPSYRIPKAINVLRNTYNSAWLYLQKAGPLILVFSMLLWFLTYFPDYNPDIDTTGLNQEQIGQLKDAERLSGSFASDLGKFIQPVMTPLGMDWRVGVSLIAAFAAREVFVSSLALIFKVTGSDDTIQNSILNSMRNAQIEATGDKLFTTSTIIGLIVFFVFALQCISTIVVSRKETGSWRIPALQLILFTSFAYLMTFITVNGLRLAGFD